MLLRTDIGDLALLIVLKYFILTVSWNNLMDTAQNVLEHGTRHTFLSFSPGTISSRGIGELKSLRFSFWCILANGLYKNSRPSYCMRHIYTFVGTGTYWTWMFCQSAKEEEYLVVLISFFSDTWGWVSFYGWICHLYFFLGKCYFHSWPI